MATNADWANAYLAQARADLAAAANLQTLVPSVFAMLMQMAFEKFAKAALLRSGLATLAATTSSHKAASRMVAAMRLQKKRMAAIGGAPVWLAAFEVVEALERAHPALVRSGEQLEYPWTTANDEVHWPERDCTIAAKLANPRSTLAIHLLDFATKLDRQFDSIFPQ